MPSLALHFPGISSVETSLLKIHCPLGFIESIWQSILGCLHFQKTFPITLDLPPVGQGKTQAAGEENTHNQVHDRNNTANGAVLQSDLYACSCLKVDSYGLGYEWTCLLNLSLNVTTMLHPVQLV